MTHRLTGHGPLLGVIGKRKEGKGRGKRKRRGEERAWPAALADRVCHLLQEGGRKPKGHSIRNQCETMQLYTLCCE